MLYLAYIVRIIVAILGICFSLIGALGGLLCITGAFWEVVAPRLDLVYSPSDAFALGAIGLSGMLFWVLAMAFAFKYDHCNDWIARLRTR